MHLSFGYIFPWKSNPCTCSTIKLWHIFPRNQRSPPTRRCGRSWAAGRTQRWWRTTARESSVCWPQTTLSWWSPPASSTSARGTATSHRSADSSTPRATGWALLSVRAHQSMMVKNVSEDTASCSSIWITWCCLKMKK